MARNVSSTFLSSVNAADADEVFLVLLTIDHADLSSPIRVTSDSVDTVSNGNTFQTFPFQIRLPTDDDDSRGALASVTIDAVDRRVVEAARTISGVPKVTIEVVLASDPDTIEISWPDFNLANHRADSDTISGELVLELLDQEPFPSGRFDPVGFPGLF